MRQWESTFQTDLPRGGCLALKEADHMLADGPQRVLSQAEIILGALDTSEGGTDTLSCRPKGPRER